MNNDHPSAAADTDTSQAMAQAADEQERGLTRRQRRVLKWLANGHGIDEVAERLDRDPEQLALRVQELLAKLGVGTAQEALDLPDLQESDDAEPPSRPERERRDAAQES